MEEIHRGSSLFNAQPNDFDNQNVIMYKASGSPGGAYYRFAASRPRSYFYVRPTDLAVGFLRLAASA